jgi:hypothetical protein
MYVIRVRVGVASYATLIIVWILAVYNVHLSWNNPNCRRVMKPVSWLNLQLRRTVRENSKVNGYLYRGLLMVSVLSMCFFFPPFFLHEEDVFLCTSLEAVNGACKRVSLYMCLYATSTDLASCTQ